MDDYKKMAEENLFQLTKQEELNNKKLLALENVIGYTSTIAFIVLIFAASFAVENTIWRIIMILTGAAIFVVGIYNAVKLEHDAGYYECRNCGKKYVPTMKAVVLALHIGRDRKMKCPYCHKKVIIKRY